MQATENETVTVHAKAGLFGHGAVHTWQMPAGCTPRQLLEAAADRLPRSVPLGCAVNGQRIQGKALDMPLQPGAQIVFAGVPDGIEIGTLVIYALVSAAVSVAVSYVASLLVPPPKPPGQALERGDETSPANAWSGVQTNYGQGQVVGIVLGEHKVGGQVIYTDVQGGDGFQATSGDPEALSLVLALGEGPMRRVGNTVLGEIDNLGASQPIPSTIKVEGNLLDSTVVAASTRVWLRPGTLQQAPLPSTYFAGTSTVQLAGGNELRTLNDTTTTTYSDADAISAARLVITFPAGVYAQLPNGSRITAEFTVRPQWRPVGESAWRFFYRGQQAQTTIVLGAGIANTTRTVSLLLSFTSNGSAVDGPIEVQLQRLDFTANSMPAGATVVNGCILRQVSWQQRQQLGYPRLALVGLYLPASDKVQGNLPTVTMTVQGLLVRVWDSTTGWSAPTWDVPAAPFDWHTYEPGRNPAWLALAFALAPFGAGQWLTEADIDLPAWRRFACWCDQTAAAESEAAFRCDLVIDSPRPIWETLQRICSAGRGTPIFIGAKLSVIYQYRDAHSDALCSVPDKAPVQLFTSGNVEDLQVSWLPVHLRPTALLYQITNAAKDYAQDVVPVEDTESTINDPNEPEQDRWRPETVQAYGITRVSQVRREGLFTHRVNRLMGRQVTFRTGPWALALMPGDNFELEHETLRPFAADVPMSCSMRGDVVASTTVVVDHAITGSGLQLVVRDPDGVPQRANVNSYLAVPGGTQLTLATAVTCDGGAPAVVGKIDKLVEEYLTVSVGQAGSLKREVLAVQWVPEVFDTTGADALAPDVMIDGAPSQSETNGNPMAADLRAVPDDAGGHWIGWTVTGRSSGARVWILDTAAGAWWLAAQTTATEVRVAALLPGRSYRIAVALASSRGTWQEPTAATATDLVPEEYPAAIPPKARGLAASTKPEGLLLEWQEQDGTQLSYFEVRAGRSWVSAAPVYRGRACTWLASRPPALGTYQVAARWRNGLFGDRAVLTVAPWVPAGMVEKVSSDELATTPGGTATGLTYDGAGLLLELAAGKLVGTYETTELDPGYVAPWFWQVRADSLELDNRTVDDHAEEAAGGDAQAATVDSMPASPARAGSSWLDVVDDHVELIDDQADAVGCGVDAGEPGALTATRLDSRYHDGSSWGAWAPHVDGIVQARKMQVRATLRRDSLLQQRQLVQLELLAFI